MARYDIYINHDNHVCDNTECQSLIREGELIIEKRTFWGATSYYHKRCADKSILKNKVKKVK